MKILDLSEIFPVDKLVEPLKGREAENSFFLSLSFNRICKVCNEYKSKVLINLALNMYKKISMRLLTVMLVLIMYDHDLFACKCLPPKSVKEEMNNSDAVIVGRVLKKEVVRITDSARIMGNDSTGHPVFEEYVIMRYEIAVEKMYKGRATKSIASIYTGSGSGDCGFSFETGGRYIIYANTAFYSLGFKFPSGENIFYTSTCTRTAAYTENEMEEIKTCLKN